MVTLEELAQSLIVLIRLGCVCRFLYGMVRLSGADEEASKYKKRTRNVVLFYVLAESIWQVKEILFFYYR
ncbi:mercury transporter [Paenibacillus sp. YN15]|uniref:mercury transporter n=1 Tax=Paenibacillus sp. YN15 TaxID=1742774 RepID=UPI000DCE8723|nr:mercury transporter [Paenibacillus sp. YN15]RAU96869.1 mercury transporter [Paenibacillus sp. YN15]